MATQTRFDLTAAIESWRNELAAQPQLSPDNRRELEKHLSDSMAELRQCGLSEEESFWLARHRVGQPQQLAEEFEKADPTNIWRERVFWILLAYLTFSALNSITFFVLSSFGFHMDGPEVILTFILSLLPLIVTFFVVSGKMTRPLTKLTRLIDGRFRLGVMALILMLISLIFKYFAFVVLFQNTADERVKTVMHAPSATILTSLSGIPYFLIFSVLLVWLMPQNLKTAKHP